MTAPVCILIGVGHAMKYISIYDFRKMNLCFRLQNHYSSMEHIEYSTFTKCPLIRKNKNSCLPQSFLNLFLLVTVRYKTDRTTHEEVNCQGSSLLPLFEALGGGMANFQPGDSALLIDYWHQIRIQLCQQTLWRLGGNFSFHIISKGWVEFQLLDSLQTMKFGRNFSGSFVDLPS